MAVTSNLDLQKRKIEEANRRVDKLVEDILYEADLSGKKVDVSKMDELNQIINRLEKVDFQGNVELLKQTNAVYDKAIKAIEEQLKSEEIKGIDPNGKASLEDAKKLLEDQSNLGRVGTMISRFEELSTGEAEKTIERRYNDSKIEEFDYSIVDRENQEKQRRQPFNKIVSVTRKPMEELNRYNEILKQIQEVDKKIKKLQNEITQEEKKSPEEQDKEAIETKKTEIKSLNTEKLKLYKSARTDEKDNEFEFDKTKDKNMSDYYKRVQASLQGRINTSRIQVIDALETIKDDEIEVCGTKMKISQYLKNYMDKTNLNKVDELEDKIAIDKALTIKAMEQEKEHKDIDELKKKKQVYVDRNKELEKSEEKSSEEVSSEGVRTSGVPAISANRKFDWRHPFKSIANWFKREKKSEEIDETRKLGEEEEKNILIQIEKEMKGNSNFRKQYTVDEQTKISTRVENTLNKQREEFYRQQNNQNSQDER